LFIFTLFIKCFTLLVIIIIVILTINLVIIRVRPLLVMVYCTLVLHLQHTAPLVAPKSKLSLAQTVSEGFLLLHPYEFESFFLFG
jgi:hypothetical protein